ncbi:MAG: ATP-binding cassette domain-containing protein [Gemmatimonadaceae bacterium]
MSGSASEGAPPSLAVEHLTKRYGGVQALDDVSVSVAPGQCLALVGESGSGKTTLLRCINRLVDADRGRVLVGGRDVRESDVVVLRRATGYVPQEGGLLPHWRVARNVALVPWLNGARDAGERAEHALTLVGLDPEVVRDRWPAELSGGQRQRVAVARALAGGQRLLLLDEPFGALDAITRHDLQEMLLSLRARGDVTIVMVTHDVSEALRLADEVLVLRRGHMEQSASPVHLRESPATPYVTELLLRSGVGT